MYSNLHSHFELQRGLLILNFITFIHNSEIMSFLIGKNYLTSKMPRFSVQRLFLNTPLLHDTFLKTTPFRSCHTRLNKIIRKSHALDCTISELFTVSSNRCPNITKMYILSLNLPGIKLFVDIHA